jgi:hypothetical protein
MRPFCYAVAVLAAAAGVRAQDEPMTVGRLFEIAGARSVAASSGAISARVTEYQCLQKGDSGLEVYDRSLSALISALEAAPADAPLNPALAAPDKAEWAVETWYEIDYVYDKGRYRLGRVTPSGSYHTAFDGVTQFLVEDRALRIEPMEKPRQHMIHIDVNLMRWDQIPPENYARDDQKSELRILGGQRYNVWLSDKRRGGAVDQIFNVETGMLERGSMRNEAGQLLQDHLWLRPVLSSGVWVPSVFVEMEYRGGITHLTVISYKKWEVRPVLDGEFTIPRDAYDTVAGMTSPVWGADNPPAAAAKQTSAQKRQSKPLLVAQPGVDMNELTKPPTESYVMRTVGLALIVIAVGLMVLYFVHWRERWNEVWKTGFGLRKK